MFATGIREIYKKINEMKGDKQKEAYSFLESQLINNPSLKHQFELLTFIKKNKNSIINQESFLKFVKKINKKNVAFIKENKISHVGIWEANKELLEYFNINSKELETNIYDSAIDIYASSKSLNESSLRKILFKKDAFLKEERKFFKERIETIKESFSKLKHNKNTNELKKNFKIVNFLSECMQSEQKTMFQESLQSIFENRKDFNNCVSKLFKLRIVAEKVIKEAEDYSDWYGDDSNFDIDDRKASGKFGSGKSTKKQDLEYLKRISIETPINKNRPDKIIFRFDIPFYPTGKRRAEAMTSSIYINNKISRMGRTFINSTVYDKPERLKLFDPVGMIWEANIGREQAIAGQQNRIKVVIYISTTEKYKDINTFNDFVNTGYAMLQDFNEMLPNLLGNYAFNLSPDASKSEGNINTDLLKKNYGDTWGAVGKGIKADEDSFDDYGIYLPNRQTVEGGTRGIF